MKFQCQADRVCFARIEPKFGFSFEGRTYDEPRRGRGYPFRDLGRNRGVVQFRNDTLWYVNPIKYCRQHLNGLHQNEII